MAVSLKVNLPHAVDLRASCGVHLVTYPADFRGGGTRVAHRVGWTRLWHTSSNLYYLLLLSSSLLLSIIELSDAKVYEPEIRARLGTAAHF